MPAYFDIRPHVKTWSDFVMLLAFTVASIVAVLLILMAAFLT